MAEAIPELPESPRPKRNGTIPRIQRLKQRYGITNYKKKKRTRLPKRTAQPSNPPPMVRWSTTDTASSQAPPKKPLNNRERTFQASVESGVSIDSIPLKRIRFDSDVDTQTIVIAAVDTNKPLSNVLQLPTRRRQQQQETDFTVVFCVRRAGCGDCRDNGLRLTELAKEYGSQMNLFGIIKGLEKGVKGDRLTKFYTEYFNFPLYEDTQSEAFKFLGNRKVSVWKLLRSIPRMEASYKRKNIQNVPFGGDIFTQGGLLFFDKAGLLRYVYYEQYGAGLNLSVLRSAIESMKNEEPTAAAFQDTSSEALDSSSVLPFGAFATAGNPHNSDSSHTSSTTANNAHICAMGKTRTSCSQAPRKPRRTSCSQAPRKPVRNTSSESLVDSVAC